MKSTLTLTFAFMVSFVTGITNLYEWPRCWRYSRFEFIWSNPVYFHHFFFSVCVHRDNSNGDHRIWNKGWSHDTSFVGMRSLLFYYDGKPPELEFSKAARNPGKELFVHDRCICARCSSTLANCYKKKWIACKLRPIGLMDEIISCIAHSCSIMVKA